MGVEDNEMNLEQLPNCFFNNSMDQKDLFESALSSFVTSPSNSHHGLQFPGVGESIVLRELIGRLGSICNSSEINSSNNSCYNTPLNSPPKVNMSITNQQIHGNENHQFPQAQFPVDVSRFSAFGSKNELTHVMETGKLSRVSSNQSFKTVGSQFKKLSKLSMELGDSLEESSVSETETGMKGQSNDNGNGRKRKVVPKGKGKETNAKDDKVSLVISPFHQFISLSVYQIPFVVVYRLLKVKKNKFLCFAGCDRSRKRGIRCKKKQVK